MPVARILPIALRVGAVAATAYTAWTLRRVVLAQSHPGRLDQRVEDALDAMDEGLSVHRSQVLGDTSENRQANVSGRFRCIVRIGGRTLEVDVGLVSRLRIRRV